MCRDKYLIFLERVVVVIMIRINLLKVIEEGNLKEFLELVYI